MRLLHTQTLEIHEFLGKDVPEYVILSHTWEEEEVLLSNMQNGRAEAKKGYRKLRGLCRKAAEDGYAYCWMDTCCIDKTSSAELSEAINSMYQYYERCQICYVYLVDVEKASQLEYARWWSRGWTLQELIAPTIVEFYSMHWLELGTRYTFASRIAKHTSIDESVMLGSDPTGMSIAVRMSWAARRTTTRIEDEAYCLLGLFEIHMPLLYGEGHAAFRRLQEHILRAYEDYSILVWTPTAGEESENYKKHTTGLLAHSPRNFATFRASKDGKPIECDFHDVETDSYKPLVFENQDGPPPPWSLTNVGLRITLPTMRSEIDSVITVCLATLETNGTIQLICVNLSGGEGDHYHRYLEKAFLLQEDQSCHFCPRTLYVYQPLPRRDSLTGIDKLNGNVPTLLTVRIVSKILDAPIRCVSRLMCIEDIKFGRTVSEQVHTRQYLDMQDYLGVMRCAVNPSRLRDRSYLSELSMGAPTLCFILQSKRPNHTLKFRPKGQPSITISIELAFFLGRPSCKAILVAPTDVEHRNMPKEEGPGPPKSFRLSIRDRSEIVFGYSDSDTAPSYTSEQRVSVSLRRAPLFHPHPESDYATLISRDASLPRTFERFMLVVKHDRVSWWHTNEIDLRGMKDHTDEEFAASSTAATYDAQSGRLMRFADFR